MSTSCAEGRVPCISSLTMATQANQQHFWQSLGDSGNKNTSSQADTCYTWHAEVAVTALSLIKDYKSECASIMHEKAMQQCLLAVFTFLSFCSV